MHRTRECLLASALASALAAVATQAGEPAANATGAATSSAAAAGSVAAPDEAAILATVDRFVLAISASDVEALAKIQLPDGMTYSDRPAPNGGTHVVGRPNSYWSDPARRDGRAYHERYWSPTVLQRRNIATVWAPYEFRIDGKTSHCGIDSFELARVDGEWRIANAMWTVEPEACAELLPKDRSTIRPPG